MQFQVVAAWSAYLLNFEFKLRKREMAVRQKRMQGQRQDLSEQNHNIPQTNPEIILHRGEWSEL